MAWLPNMQHTSDRLVPGALIPLGTCPRQTRLVHVACAYNCVSEVCHGAEDGLFVLCDRCSVLLSPHKLRS